MTDKKLSSNGQPAGKAAETALAVQVQIVGQYVKDLSFENPNVDMLITGPGESPNLNLEINVNANRMKSDLYESAINFKAHATSKAGTIYHFELVYAGLFKITSIPEAALEPFLLINCPTLLFPFLRRLVADLSREGGFPPLLLDPVDFAQLYMQRQQQKAAAESAGKPHN